MLLEMFGIKTIYKIHFSFVNEVRMKIISKMLKVSLRNSRMCLLSLTFPRMGSRHDIRCHRIDILTFIRIFNSIRQMHFECHELAAIKNCRLYKLLQLCSHAFLLFCRGLERSHSRQSEVSTTSNIKLIIIWKSFSDLIIFAKHCINLL